MVVAEPPVGAYSIEKIFYGTGWQTDPASGARRLVALLNLTQEYRQSYPSDGSYGVSSQVFILFSIPGDDTGPADGAGLKIRFSYYVDAMCTNLNETTCPLGENTKAISQDTFELEVRRVLEFTDADGSGAYEPGEPIVRDVSLSQPTSPHVRAWPFTTNGSIAELPYDWNVSDEDTDLRMGALFAGDPLLEDLANFWISVGNGVPMNLTLNSFFFLRPTTYKSVPLTPTQLKLDLLLGGIEYTATDTALAIELRLVSNQYRHVANSTASNETLSTTSDAAEAFFTWRSNATVDDGSHRPVGSTILSEDDHRTVIFLSYPRSGTISHDPVLGLSLRGTGAVSPGAGGTTGDGLPAAGPPRDLLVYGLLGAVAGGASFLAIRHRRKRI